MSQSKFLNEEELFNQAIRLLTEKLGPLETSRFLSIAGKKRMESVKRHRLWQDGLDKKTFLESVFNK